MFCRNNTKPLPHLSPHHPPPPKKIKRQQDYAEIDDFNPATALTIVSSSASVFKLSPAAVADAKAPACHLEGQSCDGAQMKCCSWGMLDCDLRPGAPSYGTCYSLTGANGYTCKKLGAECSTEFDCCPFLKCGSMAPGAPKRCTSTPEHASLSFNVTMGSGSANYSADVQQGLMSSVRHWLVHEGSGAESVRVVSVQPLAKPKPAEWQRDPTYRYEVVIGAPTRPALANAVKTAMQALEGKGGGVGGAERGGEKGAGLCGVPVSSMGPNNTICTLAEVSGDCDCGAGACC